MELVYFQIKNGRPHSPSMRSAHWANCLPYSFSAKVRRENVRILVFRDALMRICKNFSVPDCDFYFFTGDVYQGSDPGIPVLSSSKVKGHFPILIPDLEVLMRPVQWKKKLNKAEKRAPFWQGKCSKLFWRGATTGGTYSVESYLEFPRTKLTELSLQYPSLIDAKFTVLCQGAENLKGLLHDRIAPQSSLGTHLNYKYQITVDGNTTSWSRFQWQLSSSALTFKQETDHEQWFYKFLDPWKHYIPVAQDLGDLLDHLDWAMRHEMEVLQMIDEANAFSRIHFSEDFIDTVLYDAILLIRRK